MEKLIEILQNEKLSHRTKRLMCAAYALPIMKGSTEVDVSAFANFLGETKSAIIACCQELEDNGISYIEDNEAGEFYFFHAENNEYIGEIAIRLI